VISKKISIVGGGLAGLSAGFYLKQNGFDISIFEASDRIGGIVATDSVEGFYLDRGFQILIDSYPDFRRIVDPSKINLKPFTKGVHFVDSNGSQELMKFPESSRDLIDAVNLVKSFSIGELYPLAKIAFDLLKGRRDSYFYMKEQSSLGYLQKAGVSASVINRYFRPFFKGVFLEDDLSTSYRMLLFTLSNFLTGHSVIPDTGMAEIPSQIASNIEPEDIHLNSKVRSVSDRSITLEDGSERPHDFVVVATKPDQANLLLGNNAKVNYRSVACHYFATEIELSNEPTVVIPRMPEIDLATVVQLDAISKSYAPKGVHLISASTLKPDMDPDVISDQIAIVLGIEKNELSHIRSYEIKDALPVVFSSGNVGDPYFLNVSQRTFLAGDYLQNPSIDGALKSGRLASQAIMSSKLA
ncbi:unnamed protein product, partial [Acidithrix sp. C25]